MYPPPTPNDPPPNATPLPRRLAIGSVYCPLLVLASGIGLSLSTGPIKGPFAAIYGLICLLLLVSGIVFAFIGLGSIPKHGTRGILGFSVTGLFLNLALLVTISVMGVMKAQKSAQERAERMTALERFRSATHADEKTTLDNLKESYHDGTGITNIDFNGLNRLQNDMEKGSQNLTGDGAATAKAVANYLAHIQRNLSNYQAALLDLGRAKVLSTSNLTDVAQIAERREAVKNFLTASESLNYLTTNAENEIRSDMLASKVSQTNTDRFISQFDVTYGVRRDIDVQVRACDEEMGHSMLTVLDLLEKRWGYWRYDAVNRKLRFDDQADLEVYSQEINNIRAAAEKQVSLQGDLVNLPR
jgi:hypothetical protein